MGTIKEWWIVFCQSQDTVAGLLAGLTLWSGFLTVAVLVLSFRLEKTEKALERETRRWKT